MQKRIIKRKIKKKKKNHKFLFTSLLSITLIWGIIIGIMFSYYLKIPTEIWEELLPIPTGNKVNIVIESGMNARQAARAFEFGGALESGSPSELAKWFVKFGIDKRILAGQYSVVPSTAWNVARQLKTMKPALIKAMIVPGNDIFKFKDSLAAQDFNPEKVEAALMNDSNYPEGLKKFFGVMPDDKYYRLAFLQPETYMLVERNSDELVNVSSHEWWSRWEKFIKGNNLTSKDVLEASIVASMVEREVMHDSEARRVSGVIHNRLRSNMPLQIDATVVYAWRLKGRKLTRVLNKDLEINSPYNTYKNPGLPPAPICLPGGASWEASLNPEYNEYFYYVAGRDGYHYFAKTYSEHLQNIKQVRSSR